MMRLVGALQRARPDAARAGRVRERCHAALVARRTQKEAAPVRHGPGAALVGLLCAVYLAEIAWQAVTVFLAVRPT
jgi:hypothetical protein